LALLIAFPPFAYSKPRSVDATGSTGGIDNWTHYTDNEGTYTSPTQMAVRINNFNRALEVGFKRLTHPEGLKDFGNQLKDIENSNENELGLTLDYEYDGSLKILYIIVSRDRYDSFIPTMIDKNKHIETHFFFDNMRVVIPISLEILSLANEKRLLEDPDIKSANIKVDLLKGLMKMMSEGGAELQKEFKFEMDNLGIRVKYRHGLPREQVPPVARTTANRSVNPVALRTAGVVIPSENSTGSSSGSGSGSGSSSGSSSNSGGGGFKNFFSNIGSAIKNFFFGGKSSSESTNRSPLKQGLGFFPRLQLGNGLSIPIPYSAQLLLSSNGGVKNGQKISDGMFSPLIRTIFAPITNFKKAIKKETTTKKKCGVLQKLLRRCSIDFKKTLYEGLADITDFVSTDAHAGCGWDGCFFSGAEDTYHEGVGSVSDGANQLYEGAQRTIDGITHVWHNGVWMPFNDFKNATQAEYDRFVEQATDFTDNAIDFITHPDKWFESARNFLSVITNPIEIISNFLFWWVPNIPDPEPIPTITQFVNGVAHEIAESDVVESVDDLLYDERYGFAIHPQYALGASLAYAYLQDHPDAIETGVRVFWENTGGEVVEGIMISADDGYTTYVMPLVNDYNTYVAPVINDPVTSLTNIVEYGPDVFSALYENRCNLDITVPGQEFTTQHMCEEADRLYKQAVEDLKTGWGDLVNAVTVNWDMLCQQQVDISGNVVCLDGDSSPKDFPVSSVWNSACGDFHANGILDTQSVCHALSVNWENAVKYVDEKIVDPILDLVSDGLLDDTTLIEEGFDLRVKGAEIELGAAIHTMSLAEKQIVISGNNMMGWDVGIGGGKLPVTPGEVDLQIFSVPEVKADMQTIELNKLMSDVLEWAVNNLGIYPYRSFVKGLNNMTSDYELNVPQIDEGCGSMEACIRDYINARVLTSADSQIMLGEIFSVLLNSVLSQTSDLLKDSFTGSPGSSFSYTFSGVDFANINEFSGIDDDDKDKYDTAGFEIGLSAQMQNSNPANCASELLSTYSNVGNDYQIVSFSSTPQSIIEAGLPNLILKKGFYNLAASGCLCPGTEMDPECTGGATFTAPPEFETYKIDSSPTHMDFTSTGGQFTSVFSMLVNAEVKLSAPPPGVPNPKMTIIDAEGVMELNGGTQNDCARKEVTVSNDEGTFRWKDRSRIVIFDADDCTNYDDITTCAVVEDDLPNHQNRTDMLNNIETFLNDADMSQESKLFDIYTPVEVYNTETRETDNLGYTIEKGVDKFEDKFILMKASFLKNSDPRTICP